MYVIHSMHGPTVFQFERLGDALDWLFAQAKRMCNGGMYRICDERGREFASVNTCAIYAPLCWEANHPK